MKKRYIVTGPLRVAGGSRGDIVELDLLPELEEHLLSVGHLKPAPPPKKVTTETEHD